MRLAIDTNRYRDFCEGNGRALKLLRRDLTGKIDKHADHSLFKPAVM